MASIPPNTDYKWKASGYGKIEKLINEVEKDFDVLFVTDLNYTEEQFRLLGSLKKSTNKIIYIDHHAYETYDVEALGEELGIKVVWDKRFAGCLNTYFYLNGPRWFPQLNKLNHLGDTYDRWCVDDQDFLTEALPLTDLFWEYSMYKFIDKFKDGYSLDQEDLMAIHQKKQERITYLQDSYKNHTIKNKNILMVMNPKGKFTNDYTIFFPEYDAYIMLLRSEEGKMHFSIRLRDRFNLNIHKLYSIMEQQMGKKLNCGGHSLSGGVSIDEDDYNDFMDAFNNGIEELTSGT